MRKTRALSVVLFGIFWVLTGCTSPDNEDGIVTDAAPSIFDSAMPNDVSIGDAEVLEEVGATPDASPANDHDCSEDPDVCHAFATCVEDAAGDDRCVCSDDFEGDGINDCRPIADCVDDPCLNGGECEETLTGVECICPQEFTGTHCESPVYSTETLAYFFEVALGSEFGDFSTSIIRKWQSDLTLELHGQPTMGDLEELDRVIAEINDLQSAVRLVITDSNGNVQLHFTTPDEFSLIEPNYVPGNDGFFWTYWFGAHIVRAHIFVNIEQQDVFRNHLMREELTQSLGLMNDSNRYEDSIFYQPWSDTDEFSSLDQALIQILYRDDVRAGMNREALMEILQVNDD